MAYRAEIEIGVKGASQLKQLQERIKDLAFRAEALQVITNNLYSSKAVQNVRNYTGALNEAKSALDAVEIATKDESNAVREYVTALGEANAASARQNKLIEEEITLRNKAKQGLQTQRRREEYLAGPGRTAPTEKLAQRSIKEAGEREARFEARKTFAEEIFNIEKNFDKKLRDTAIDNLLERFQLEENLQKRSIDKLLQAGKAEGEDFDRRLAQQTTDRLSANKKVNSARVRQRAAIYRLEQRRLRQTTRERLRAEEAVSKKRKDALGSAIIGGAFPLLFGQGIGAAVGGGAGGAAGGLIGGQFGFGLSLVGTALGSSFDALAKSTAELGAALDPVNADVDKLIVAMGGTKTETEAYIKALQAAGRATEAAYFAFEQLEKIVGTTGVSALRTYGEQTQELQNELQKFFTQMQAGLAELIVSTGILRGVIDGVNRKVTITQAREARGQDAALDAALNRLDKEQSTVASGLSGFGIARLVPAEATEAELAVLKEAQRVLVQNVDAKQILNNLNAESIEQINRQNELQEGLLAVERLGGDIKDKAVQEQLRLNIELKYTAEQQDLINQLRSEEADFLVITAKLQGVQVKYQKELAALQNRINRPAGGGRGAKPPESKALSLQRQITQERLNIADIENKIRGIGRDQLVNAIEEGRQIEIRKNAQIEALEYARQDALNKNKVKGDEALINEFYDARLLKINKIADLATKENRVLIERIALERELAKLAGERETEDIGIGLRRQIDAVERRISSPFGGQDLEMLELRTQQVQRQEDAFRALDRQIEDVGMRLKKDPGNEDLQQNLRLLQERRLKYEELLPVLDQVEQKELKLQQTLQQLQPLTNALSQGLTDLFTGLVDGSKDAQEVFADMLKNMGQALIQQGAVMIAQYIAIGIARMFAGLGGGNRVGPENFNLEGFGSLPSMPFMPFAEGGYVTRPTNALIGEGSEPEYVLPASKMPEALERYSAGVRGSAVIPSNGDSGGMTGASGGGGTIVNYNGPTLNFNSEDYVPASAVPGIIDEATKRGAKAGEARTFATLRNSRSQRGRIGLGR